ncbi:hypothetical protein ACOMHN_059901 [Nucella lapillus]
MITGKESEVIHGIEQKDDCEIFLLKAAEPSLPTFASTAVCQDTAKATDRTPADGVNIILTNAANRRKSLLPRKPQTQERAGQSPSNCSSSDPNVSSIDMSEDSHLDGHPYCHPPGNPPGHK